MSRCQTTFLPEVVVLVFFFRHTIVQMEIINLVEKWEHWGEEIFPLTAHPDKSIF